MNGDAIEVKLGRVQAKVPIYKTEEDTLRLVDLINERLLEIEAQSDRIDTQAFALKAAYAFAVEAAKSDDEREQDTHEFFAAVHAIAEGLQELLDQARGEPA